MIVRRSFAAGALALSLFALPAAAQAPADAFASDVTQVVKIKQGALKSPVKDGVAYSLGIPYAAPPVGDLRWKPPMAAASWTGERDAAKAGPRCQDVEDCLTLNVVRPAGAKPGAKLPVMVWIHGGAYVIGTSMGAFGGDTDGTNFAKDGIVHVSLNYRLGRAGWFAHPALTKEGPTGNYGMMDQIAALKWVQANIASFGGDPKKVTIYGESAGGVSVLYLMLSPDAQGLFAKVIGESSFSRHIPTPLKTAEAAGLKAANDAGVQGEDAAAAAALRKVPLTAMPYSGGLVGRAGPILDGKYVTAGIAQGFAAGRQSKVPLMIGGNSNEASLVRPQAAQLDAIPEPQKATLLKAFDPSGAGDKARIINDVVTVQMITEPDRNTARLHSKAGQPVYLYYFSHVAAAGKDRKPHGAGHTDEIRYVFGAPTAPAKFDAADKALSDAMHGYWASFAKTGNPRAGWPKFDPANERQVEFGDEGVRVREHFLKDQRDTVEAGAK
ncbi:MAG: carboxylesterase family protein [Alphaproteobacteria bacterium]|nr:carboxylesterase family protein [Alphaproteobacteria bacterium]MBU1514151.1 carboxylesterase family protein [Alphaproteobacteria bacterium]MBU2096200.1 carboxylesterase family protein [Alphaproteobacteria bacterium]MBU2151154.1 carboxylesterase family protein [Alphaproteobacteria bacterium]MBU2307187.1 carboxylesterase family protein [Alphaproteobacteria bacterium]